MFMNTAFVFNSLVEKDGWIDGFDGFEPEKMIEKAKRIVAPDDIYVVYDDIGKEVVSGRFGNLKPIEVANRTISHVFNRIHRELKGYDHIIYLFIDEPLFDVEATKEMLKLHMEEYAEYTYGEGYPPGVVPEIFVTSLLPKLVGLAGNDDGILKRDTIFKLLSKEINSFDIETYFAAKDLRLMRFELNTSVKRNSMIVSRIVKRAGTDCGYERLVSIIDENPDIIRTVPAFVEIEVTNRTNHVPAYSPASFLKRKRGDMTFDQYKTVIDKIKSFSETFYVSLSYLGEPLLHPDIKDIVSHTVEDRDIDCIIETDGTKFTPDFTRFIADLNAPNLHIIFQVDAVKNDTYREIHGTELKYVERNLRYLVSKKRDNVYAQMVRMNKNEDEMLRFYEIWEKEGVGVIIKKYNSYLGLLPPLSDADLKPLDRNCCWHLLRDLVVFNNGDVPRCGQDINAHFLLGNIFRDEIDHIWDRGSRFYLEHCRKKYDEYCSICDEYYVFNF